MAASVRPSVRVRLQAAQAGAWSCHPDAGLACRLNGVPSCCCPLFVSPSVLHPVLGAAGSRRAPFRGGSGIALPDGATWKTHLLNWGSLINVSLDLPGTARGAPRQGERQRQQGLGAPATSRALEGGMGFKGEWEAPLIGPTAFPDHHHTPEADRPPPPPACSKRRGAEELWKVMESNCG